MRRTRFNVPVRAVAAFAAASLVFARYEIGRAASRNQRLVDVAVGVRPLVHGEFNVRDITVDGRRFAYQVFVPSHYDPQQRWPVILCLHGAGERGTDNRLQVGVGLALVVKEQATTFPAIVVFPQIPPRTAGPQFAPVAMEMLNATIRELHGDPQRVYLTGISFGGSMAYSMAYDDPTKFAAVVPVAAPIMSGWMPGMRGLPPDALSQLVAERLKDVPMWLFHGSADGNAPVENARLIARALERVGAPARYTEYPGVGHNSWDNAYRNPELFPWLFSQHR